MLQLCSIFKMPIALVTLLDRDRQWFKSVQGLGEQGGGSERRVAFCAWTFLPLHPEVLIVPDARLDGRRGPANHSAVACLRAALLFASSLSACLGCCTARLSTCSRVLLEPRRCLQHQLLTVSAQLSPIDVIPLTACCKSFQHTCRFPCDPFAAHKLSP